VTLRKTLGDTCFRVLEKQKSFPLSEGCSWKSPGYDSDIGSVGTSL